MCKADRSDGEEACKRRDELLAQIPTWKTRNMALKGIKRIQDTYSLPRPGDCFALYSAHSHLADMIFQQDPVASIQFHMKAIEHLGAVVHDHTMAGPLSTVGLPVGEQSSQEGIRNSAYSDKFVQTCLRLSDAFATALDEQERARRWLAAAIWCTYLAGTSNRNWAEHSHLRA